MTGARRPTLRDIAEALGLSVNTVSRALAGKSDISARTRRLVEAEAQRIGYVPNTLARSLVLGSAMTLGLVITTPSNPFYAQLIHGVEVQGRKHGYSMLLLVTDESEEIEQGAVESLLRAAVDGVLAVPVQGESDPWHRLATANIPLVLVNRDLPAGRHDFVGIDYEQGAYDATRHAIEAGARRIWMLEEDLPITTIAGRIAGFRRAMAEAGLPVPDDAVRSVPTRRHESAALPWQPQESYVVAQEIVDRGDRPDAVLVGNDYFALGLYRALAERGLRVPDDMLVLGYGDFPFSGFLTPPLTSVRLPAYEVGASAVDLLVERVRDRSAAPAQKRLLRPDLVVRPSSTLVTS
jgi:LacI family transcriptional regulator